MPGRRGYAVSGGWATSGGASGLPATLTLNGRTGNQPSEYKATDRIDFEAGFISADGDAFEAYLTNEAGSNGNSSLNGDNSSGGYRYGFNGKEQDPEVDGEGNQYDYGFRIYNPRLGRFLSVDPLTQSYPWYTPYQFAGNNPIWFIDLDGLEQTLPELDFRDVVIKNPSESTCQGCAERQQMIIMKKQVEGLEQLKKEYETWAHKSENWGKPLPVQYQQFVPKAVQPTFNQGGYLGSNEYKLAKANFDTYGQYLPGLGDLADGLTALNELGKGNYVGAAAAAFFLIPGADVFKPIKSLKGVGGELLEGYIKKFGNQSKHLSKLDVAGALKDIAGKPVIINGKVYNHLKEVEDALAGVGNQLDKLNKDINAGKFTEEVLKQAQVIRSTLQKQKDKITNVLNEAKNAK